MEELLRALAPRVLGVLVRRYGSFNACEDAVQEALIAATLQWPDRGIPEHPASWLITVAARRLIDARRSEAARYRREVTAFTHTPTDEQVAPAADEAEEPDDDTLTLLMLCCHPDLSPSAQMALTLRAVGGLTTAQIARAFLVSEVTMSRRIVRAKQRVRDSGSGFAMPPDTGERLPVVLHVLYLIFNEGYTASSGPDLHDSELTGEAIRLARELHRLMPDHGEVAGLLALMLLTEAHRPARTGPDGVLVPLAAQDRSLWDQSLIDEGRELIGHTLKTAQIGPYQLQAAIAAVHADAPIPEDTDWDQILVLYRMLHHLWPSPVVALNQAIALAMAQGVHAGLDLLATLDDDPRMTNGHRLYAVRAHLLEMAGDREAALAAYGIAARSTTSLPERLYLETRAQKLADGGTGGQRT